MKKLNFKSTLRDKEKDFINFKKSFGHSYESQTYYLLDFDRFCVDEFPDTNVLTEEMVMKWAVIRPTENSNGYVSRICVIRQFGKYLSMLGEDAFILPNGLKGGNTPLMPYVFTQETLQDFFTYTDTMKRYYQSTVRHLVAPVMFRYMYCCGLRPIEARRLDRNDINLDNGRIFIKESKYNKERIIYAPDELMQLTQDYLKQIIPIFPNSESLFVDRRGSHFSKDAHQYLFEHCRIGARLTPHGTKQPNLYSFRHSFATHRIYQWHKEGKDIDAFLPGLSAYMGHSKYSHTLYYLHLLPELFSDVVGFDFEKFSNIIPEVDGYDD